MVTQASVAGLPLIQKEGDIPAVLMGDYRVNMDAKGRVTIPARFREDLGDRFYVTKGLDGCLFVLSAGQWNTFVEKVSHMPVSKARSLQRFFFSGACEAEPDKQGRILLPVSLREYARLEKDVTVSGAGVRAEIWDTGRWQAYNEMQDEKKLEEIMELMEL